MNVVGDVCAEGELHFRHVELEHTLRSDGGGVLYT